MNKLSAVFTYSVGKKLIMATTGLFLILFLGNHLYTNLLIIVFDDNGKAFNEASHFLVTNPIIRVVEIFLFLSIIFHAATGIRLIRKNKKARPVGYQTTKASPNTFWTSRNMAISGIIILGFIILHMYDFFLPYRIVGEKVVDGVPMKFTESPTGEAGFLTLYDLTVLLFQQPIYSIIYILVMFLLGMHLHHGFSSAFRTLGLTNQNYIKILTNAGIAISVLISVGFASIPFYFLIQQIL
jgi:succinate dehydrogenase / fumarate reductase cytochrome b subunit